MQAAKDKCRSILPNSYITYAGFIWKDPTTFFISIFPSLYAPFNLFKKANNPHFFYLHIWTLTISLFLSSNFFILFEI